MTVIVIATLLNPTIPNQFNIPFPNPAGYLLKKDTY